MKVYLVELQIFNKVRFYSLRKENENDTEAEKFFSRFSDSENKSELDLIVALIKSMGNSSGAQERFFRSEREGQAIPSRKAITFIEPDYDESGFSLRLYCLRINDRIVILGNGGIKTSQTYQDSPDCRPHAELIQRFIKSFDQAVRDGEIILNDDIIVYQNSIAFDI